MPELRNNFFEGILFRYESCSCDCVEDVQHVSKNEEPNRSYKLQAIPSENKLFAYAAQRGLVRIAKNGTVEESIFATLQMRKDYNDELFRNYEAGHPKG